MPDNTFITAKIGGGKSRCAVGFVCEELEKSERLISTSLPLFLDDHWHQIPRGRGRIRIPPEIPSWWLPDVQIREVPDHKDSLEIWMYGLETWCHNMIDKPVDLNKRLRLLKHEEIPRFYLHLPNYDLPEVTTTMPGRKPFTLPDLTARHDAGCMFVLDEVHIYFSAHGWAEAGPGVEMYQSQLRHLNDDMVMVSQHLEKVNKNFRRNATRTYELSNLGNTRLWAGVTIKERFQWRLYSGIPVRGDKPIDSGKFMLRERGLCWLYDTMAGAGVSGGMKADAPPKGRHWSIWFGILGAILLAAWFVPKLAMHGFGYGVGHMVQSMESGVTRGVMGGKAPPPDKARPHASGLASSGSANLPVSDQNQQIQLTTSGWTIFNGQARVFLSDGTVLDSRTDHFTIMPDRVVTKAATYKLHRINPVLAEPIIHFNDGFDLPAKVEPDSSVTTRQDSVAVIGQAYFARRPLGSVQVNYSSSLPSAIPARQQQGIYQ